MLVMSFVYYPIGLLGTCGHCFNSCAELAAIIVAGVFRFSTDGARCSNNITAAPGYDWTGSSVGKTYEGIFISQCVLLMVESCFIWCMVSVVWTIVGIKKSER